MSHQWQSRFCFNAYAQIITLYTDLQALLQYIVIINAILDADDHTRTAISR